MPRFAANLAYLFTERPFMERFAAAAAAGFKAVELQFPYEFAPSAVRAELERHGLAMLGINTSPGRREAGEFGLAAVAGREADFAALFRQALDYVVAIGGRRSIASPAKCRRRRGPRPRRSSSAILPARPMRPPRHDITLLIEPINPRDRPDYFLAAPSTPPTSSPRSSAPMCASSSTSITRRSWAAISSAASRNACRRSVTSRSPRCPRAHEPDEGEVNYPAIFAALDRLGYGGWIGCEYNPRARTEDGLGWARPFGVSPPNY